VCAFIGVCNEIMYRIQGEMVEIKKNRYFDFKKWNYQKNDKNHTLGNSVNCFKVFNYFMENCVNGVTVYGVTTSIGLLLNVWVWDSKIQIPTTSHPYFVAISLFRSRLLSRATKIMLYKTPIRPVVLCGAEAWTLTKKEEQAVLIFGVKIFRRMYGPKYENGNGKVG